VHRDVAIIGAGYVGVPLAQVFAEAGRSVLLVDVSEERVAQLNRGESYIEDVPSATLKRLVDGNGIRATTDYDEIRDCDPATSSCSSRRPIRARRGTSCCRSSSAAPD
jgi:UDP-N-acetyl-D-glucosamine dehydrogenase